MGLEKLINREIKITIGVVLFVSILFIALSYAIFKVDKSGASDVIKFGDISLSFCKDSTCASNVSNIGNIIGTETDSNGNTVYSKIYPVADPVTNDDWNNLKPYIFTLTNTGSLPLYVSIFLERDMTAGVISDGTSEYSEFVSDDQVKIGFGVQGETPAIGLYSDYLNVTDNNHKIASNIQIGVGETKIFNLYAWLKSDAQNASLGKYFVTQISARGEYLPDGENTQIDENLKTIEIDFKEGTIDKNIKQVQKGNNVEFSLTPSDTSVTLDKLNITCLSGTVPTVSGNTLTISNVQKNEFCQVYKEKVPLLSQILKDNPTIKTRTTFTRFTETNRGTLYKATEQIGTNPVKDVYYFAGDAKNNWVKFGKTTESSCTYKGKKVFIYNGGLKNVETQTECETYSLCNSKYLGPVLVENSSMCGNVNGTILTEKATWNGTSTKDIYWRIIRTNHDGSIRLLYVGTGPDTTTGNIGTSAFDTYYSSPMYVGYKQGGDTSLDTIRNNKYDSTIKITIDTWYKNNLTNYTKYLSTSAVYCNDRSLGTGQTYSASSRFNFASYYRMDDATKGAKANPSYNCTDIRDAFSVDNTSAKLDFPIALMTADEIAFAGGVAWKTMNTPYAWFMSNSVGTKVSSDWWSLSPGIGWGSSSSVWYWDLGSDYAYLRNFTVQITCAVRPAISLKSCIKYSTGNGTPETPYEIDYDNSNC